MYLFCCQTVLPVFILCVLIGQHFYTLSYIATCDILLTAFDIVFCLLMFTQILKKVKIPI